MTPIKRAAAIIACASITLVAACGNDEPQNEPTSSTSTSSTSAKPNESAPESPKDVKEHSDKTAGHNTRPEAPGQAEPSGMNKTVASCGDPSLHETGTTFFTDGTSGWTQQCANKMMAQQPAATPEPAPTPAAPATEQQSNYVTPGAYCSGGGTGVSKNGTPMTCSVGPDGEARWRSQ